MEEPLVLKIQTEGGEEAAVQIERVDRALGKTEKSSKKSGESMGIFSKSLRGLGTGFGFALGASGLAGLTFGLGDAISKAEQFQTINEGLKTALKNSGLQINSNTRLLTKYAEASAGHGGFASAQELQQLTVFTTQTGAATTAMKLNTAAMNLARGAHLSYAQAAKLVATAESGTPGRLARIVGPIVAVSKYTDSWTSAMKKANPVGYQHAQLMNKQATAVQILARVQAKEGGQMAAYSKTAAGAMSNLTNQVDVIGEKLGALLIPYLTKAAHWLSNFIDQFERGKGAGGRFKTILEDVWGAVKKVVGDVAPIVAKFSPLIDLITGKSFGGGGKRSAISGFIGDAKKDFESLEKAAIPVIHQIIGVIKQLGAYAHQVFNGSFVNDLIVIGKFLMGVGTILVKYIFAVMRKELPALEMMFKGVFNIIGGLVRFVADLLQGKFGAAFHDVGQVLKGFVQLFTGAFLDFTAPIRVVAGFIWSLISGAFTKVLSFVKGVPSTILGFFSGLAHGIAGIFDAVVNGGIIGPINAVIAAIDKIHVKLPFGLGKIGFNIPQIGTIGSAGGGGNTNDPTKKTNSAVGHQHALGGMVYGSGHKDNIPDWLKPGEFVATDRMVNDVGKSKFEAWRAGGPPPGGGDGGVLEATIINVMDGKVVGQVLSRVALQQKAKR